MSTRLIGADLASARRKPRHPSDRNLQLINNADARCPESWVELAPPSRGSLCSSVDAVVVTSGGDATDKVDRDGSRLSPVSVLQSPHIEMETSLEQVNIASSRICYHRARIPTGFGIGQVDPR